MPLSNELAARSDAPVADATADATPPVTADVFERRYGLKRPARRIARDLYRRLTRTSPDAALPERVAWLESLLGWLLARHRKVELFGAADIADGRTARLAFLTEVLAREPELALRARAMVGSLLRDASTVKLLCSTGLPSEAGFLSELSSRLASAVLPEAPDDRDLAQPLLNAFRRPADVEWLAGIEAPRLAALASVLMDEAVAGALHQQRDRALAIVAARVAAMGLAEDFMARAGDVSPFLRLGGVFAAGPHVATEAPRAVLAECAAACDRVRSHLEEFGVSTDLVYRLEAIHQGLDRARALLLDGQPASAVLASVLTDARHQKSVGALVSASSRQLARKIVERSGSTGDHYITSSRREWFGMLGSAAGGGVLTSGTTVFKYLVGWLGLPLFVEGAANSVNYAVSFLLMQMVGFTLATKQPSMTAAALARALEQDRTAHGHDTVVSLIARMVRSQLAAVIGNLGFVIPAALALDVLHEQVFGKTFLDAYAGQYVVHSLNPAQSGTIFYAALTGVLLWASSVCAGWLDNWVTYRRLPDALARNKRLNALLGRRISGWAGRTVGRAASGFASCVSLGVFLGMVPLASKVFGLPFDVRHVTLSTGGLTLAVRGLGLDGFLGAGGLWAIAGIGVIGLLNFGVSFACALFVAVRARDIDWREDRRLIGAVIRGFVRSPGRFLFPPRNEAASSAHGAPASGH